jgi:hypothetical protein
VESISPEKVTAPIDWILWVHIVLQGAVWGILFPIGMVLGLARSRWHVPLQATGILLTFGGYILGHSHKGREFPSSAHGKFSGILVIPILAQLVIGIYLKLHVHEKSIRPYVVLAHGIIGKSYPILGWTQILFGGIILRGYCLKEETGQCLAHYIMGSGFISYGIIMAIIMLVGEQWMRRIGRSPEYFDSIIITVWGVVNTFTEHHGGDWSIKDMQHTILGVLWWTGGILGIYLSRNNQRSVVPSVIIFLTGWAMSDHAQALMLATKVHGMFGRTLMLAGLTRIIEVCYFVPSYATLGDLVAADDTSEDTLADGPISRNILSSRSAGAKAWQHLPPFLLVASGLLFMSATDEQLQFVHRQGMDHVTYLLSFYSLAFLLYAFVVFLVNLYSTSGQNAAINRSDTIFNADGSNIQMITPGGRSKWYSRVPSRPHMRGGLRQSVIPTHVLGDDEEEDEITPRMEMINVATGRRI